MALSGEVGSAEPRVLGRYEILRPLARGGMAQLHLARFGSIEGFEKLAVVKRLRPEHAERSDIVQMFLSEVRMLANMQHPNIVHVYDVGADAGAYWFAMEFLHGQDLRALVRKTGRQIPLEHALTIVTAMLAGLHYVHERRNTSGEPLGIIHRDVSPPNIFVTYDGNVKLLDFGIAKMERSAHTQAGVLKGKVRYMAPEQASGEPVDRRTDVFAAGIVLWELTVGRKLFDAKNDVEVLVQITTTHPTYPSAIRPDYPAALEAIVMKALERDPAKRYQTAREMQQELEAFARDAKLALSPENLEAYMHETFRDDLDAWQQAQREGKALSEHLNDRLPVSTGTFPSASGSTSNVISGSQSSQFAAVSGRASRGRALLIGLVALAALALAASIALVFVLRHESAAPVSSAATAAAPAEPTALATEPAVTAVTAAAAATTQPTATAAPEATATTATLIAPVPLHPHVIAAGHPLWRRPSKKPDSPPADTNTPQPKATWDKDSPLPPP